MVHDEHAAEDIVQTLFIQLYEKNNMNTVDNIEGYLLRSVRFRCIDHIRKDKKSVFLSINKLTAESANHSHDITEEEIEPLFYYYAAKLPPRIREVFLLSRVSKLSYKEIAEELNISQKTVENQMGSALKKLRKIVQEEHYHLLFL